MSTDCTAQQHFVGAAIRKPGVGLQEELGAAYKALQVADLRIAELAAGLEAAGTAATAAADHKVRAPHSALHIFSICV